MKRALTFLLVLTLAACTQDNSTIDATGDTLPTDQGQDFANGYTSNTEQAVSSISLDDVITAVSVPKAAPVGGNALPAGCRTIEEGSNDDDDNDGVPKEVTYRFNASKCLRQIPGGTRTLEGKLRISNEGRGGYREQLEVTITDQFATRKVVEKRNGTGILTTLRKNGKQFVKFIDLRVTRRVNEQTEFAYQNKITYTFVPDATDNDEVNKPLPAGTVSVSGKTDWFVGRRLTRSYVVSTPNALTYDPACAKTQSQGIIGGIETLNQNGKLVQITYEPCGTGPSVKLEQ